MTLWPHWSRPLWLLLLPILLWLVWKLLLLQRRKGGWQRIIPKAFQPWLLSQPARGRNHFPLIVLALGWLLALLALSGPSWRYLTPPTHLQTEPLVILLQMTPDMLADDLPPNRLSHVRRKLVDLLEWRQQALTGIVVYAGSAHVVVPLSNDRHTTLNLLHAITPAIMPVPGQRADLAVQQGLQLLQQAALGRGRLLLISDGLDTAETRAITPLMEKHHLPVSVLGTGTLQGAPVAGADGRYLEEAAGNIRLARLDEAGLQQLAQNTGGKYQRIRWNDQDLKGLGLLDSESATGLHEISADRQWIDQGYWLLLPLLLLAACASRQGWLFLLPLCMLLPPSDAFAFDFEDWWRRPDQQGLSLLQQHQPLLAAQRFDDFRWQGWASFQALDYAAAVAAFAKGNYASDHYNRGNALVGLERYTEAIDAYRQALALDPGLTAAQQNKSRVEYWLQQSKTFTATTSPTAPPIETTEPATPSQDQTSTIEHSRSEGEQRVNDLWLRMIPDDPSELLRRKFWYQQQMQEPAP